MIAILIVSTTCFQRLNKMRSKLLLFAIFSGTLFGIATLITLLYNTAPETPTIIAGFYGSLAVTVFGLSYFSFFAVHYGKYRAVAPWQATLTSIRISTILAISAAIVVAMSSFSIATPATVVALLVMAVLFELVWRRRRIGT